MTRPIKVAVIGGGCASTAAAFELTRPEHAGRYDVTIYQVGWRLGGKGASGRGVAGRIEEHGLHVWMGFYENAFRIMRECYAELDRDPTTCPIATWRDAFTPAPFVGVVHRSPDGTWLPWMADLPLTEGLPGDPYEERPRWSVPHYLAQALALLRTLLTTLQPPDQTRAGSAAPAAPRSGDSRDRLLERLGGLLKYGELATLAALIEAVELLETMGSAFGGFPENVVTRFLEAIASSARGQLEARAERDVEIQRLWTIMDLTFATIRGIVRFNLTTDPRGFDAIDEYDCREWLRLNGATEQSLASGYLRALYDLGFSYENGDAARPRIAAGQALRSMVRAFFTYRGSFFWRMEAGMGDVVFAPLYEVLKRRGVRFEFFHRLENVRLSGPVATEGDAAPHVAALEFDVQADIVDGREYAPLVDVGGLPCWPAAPDYGQLVDGARLEREGRDFESYWNPERRRTRTLRVGEDFDLVVLGVGIGAVPDVCREIVLRDPRWRAMVDHVGTVATQALQLWMSADMRTVGWPHPQITLSGFVEPFDTWADMRHLIAREAWQDPPRALAYFCSVLPDLAMPSGRYNTRYPSEQRERVWRNAVRFLGEDVGRLWPGALGTTGTFRWDLLLGGGDGGVPEGGPLQGEARLASQFWTANVNPSDRYTLSLPGSSAYRISPLDDTYDNLTIVGDWTDCGFNAGCVEAAVMSGRLGAHAIAGLPRLGDIIGFDHP